MAGKNICLLADKGVGRYFFGKYDFDSDYLAEEKLSVFRDFRIG